MDRVYTYASDMSDLAKYVERANKANLVMNEITQRIEVLRASILWWEQFVTEWEQSVTEAADQGKFSHRFDIDVKLSDSFVKDIVGPYFNMLGYSAAAGLEDKSVDNPGEETKVTQQCFVTLWWNSTDNHGIVDYYEEENYTPPVRPLKLNKKY